MSPFYDKSKCRRTKTILLVGVRQLCYLWAMEVQSVRELAAVVRSLRREKGWSQAVLAREAGVGREWVIHLEKARPTVEMGLVMGTLKALGVRLRIEPQVRLAEPGIDLNRILDDPNPSRNP